MFSGYAVGGILAALIGKQFIETYGWQSVFIAAGAPLLLIPFIMKSMPESLPFLIKHHDDTHLRQVVSRLQPGLRMEAHEEFLVPAEDKAEGAPVGKLFHDGRGLSTVMFWIAFFMGLFMIYALSSWLTKLMAMAGYSLGSALTFFLALNVGAMVGAICGWLARRQVPHQVRAGGHVCARGGLPVPDDRQDVAGSAVPDRRSRGRVARPARRS